MVRSILFVMALASPAAAWDGNQHWESATTGPTSGAGGIWGTGGKTDFGIACTHCHVPPAGGGTNNVNLVLTFAPSLSQVGGVPAYRPGQKYTVTATMTGESKGLSACGQFLTHTNGFGAAFELPNGTTAGRVESNLGMNATSCPSTVAQTVPDSTITYGNCHAVVSAAVENKTSWTFAWTAPAAGNGNVTLYWGVVDGDCDMMSMGDNAKADKRVLVEGIAAVDEEPARSQLARRLATARGASSVKRVHSWAVPR